MSGKARQAHRTKNNVRPSSSGRSAELLSSTVNPALVKVGPGNLLPAVFPSLAGQTIQPVNNDFLLCFKKFHKKDPITKLKALNELNDLVDKYEQEEVVNALGSWAHYYPSLTVDMDRKVREATQACHGAIVRKCGRQLARHIKRLLPAWLMAQHDDHAPVQRRAQADLQATFPNQKLVEAIKFCKVDICNQYMDNLKNNADHSLSGKKADDDSEPAAQRARVTSATLRALRLLLATLPADHDDWLWAALLPLLCSNTHWKLVQHPDPQVRAAMYSLTGGVVARFRARLDAELARRGARSLLAHADAAPAVCRERWRAAAGALLAVPDFLDLVDKKLLENRLLEMFENAAWGAPGELAATLPALLPLFASDRFYDKLFTALFKGLRLTALSDESEREQWAAVIAGCVRLAEDTQPELAGRAARSWLHAALALPALRPAAAAHLAALLLRWAAAGPAHPALDDFWPDLRSATAPALAAPPAADTVKLIDAHLQMLVGLKRALTAPEEEDGAARERCARDVEAAAHYVVGRVLRYAHEHRLVRAVLPLTLPALEVFPGPDFLGGVARAFECAASFQFYDEVLKAWLVDDAQRCEPVVELAFLLLEDLSVEEQDAVFDSFGKMCEEVVRWCVRRGLAGARGARRWLRAAAAERALVALAARHEDPAAVDLLLAAMMHEHGEDILISETAIRDIVAACTALLDERGAHAAGGDEGRVRWAARVLQALGARAAAALPLLLALFRLTLDHERAGSAAWTLALSAWRGGAARLPPAPRAAFERDARALLHAHLYRGVEELDIERVDHAVSLCLYFLEDGERGRLEEHSRRLLRREDGEEEAGEVPLAAFALQADVVWGELPCPLADEHAWLAHVVAGVPAPSARTLARQARRALFRAGLLRLTLRPPAEPLRADYFRDQLYDVLHDYAVLNALYDHYAFSKYYDIIREAKEHMDTLVSEMVGQIPADVRDVVARTLLDRALHRGYYWARANYEYERVASRREPPGDHDRSGDSSVATDQFVDAAEEPEHSQSSSFEILDAAETAEPAAADPSAVCRCHGLPPSPRDEFAPLLPDELELDAGEDGPRSPLARTPLASKCERLAAYRDFLGAMMLRSGFFHVAQMKALEAKKARALARMRFNEQQDAALAEGAAGEPWADGPDHYRRVGVHVDENALLAAKEAAMVRAYSCVYAATAPRLDELVRELGAAGGRRALDAVINGYYRHNDTMLFDRSLAGASWLQLSGAAGVLDALAAAVAARGWEAPALHWDFTNIALCSALSSLALSLHMYTDDDVKMALVARPALELFVRVRRFVGGVRRECTRRQPSAHVAALPQEWADIFAPDVTRNMYLIVTHVLEKWSDDVSTAQAAILQSLSDASRLLEASALPAALATGAVSVERAARAAGRALAATAHHGYKYLAFYTLRALTPAMIAADEARLAARASEEEEPAALSLALLDEPLDQLQELLDAALSAYTACEDVCAVAPHTDSAALALGHLLLSAALLRLCARATGELALHYGNFFNTHGYVEGILPTALRLLPADAAHYMVSRLPALPRRLLPWFLRLQDFHLDEWCGGETVSRLACGVLLRALGGPGGAAARGWWAVLGARQSAALARLVAAAVAPPLAAQQLAAANARAASLGLHAQLAVCWSERSVALTVRSEEGRSSTLRVALSAVHPLRPPTVSGSGAGPDPLLFLIYFGHQNGRVFEALQMWAAAVAESAARGAAGGPLCYVCYYRAHPLDRSLPTTDCAQCRNVFHPRCVRRWFKTSNRSNCPVCRTNF